MQSSFFEKALGQRKLENRYRSLKPVNPLDAGRIERNGKTLINFCSNDYLGLARHPLLRDRSIEFTEKFGTGSAASRLVCGSLSCFDETENKIAALKETEAALIFNSGFQANVSAIPALADRKSLILSDKLNHNSLIQGALLSGGTLKRYPHNDLDRLEGYLEEAAKENYSRTLIVTESVFSMDGDVAAVEKVSKIAEKFGALLMVDEAHATGVKGKRGMGLTVGNPVDIVIGTFGKALGSFGAYIACSRTLKEYLINCCSGFIYTTALPPGVVGAIDAALDLVPEMNAERASLEKMGDRLRKALAEMGYDTLNSTSQIVPLVLGEETKALDLADFLESSGYLAMAIRPPTVPPGKSRIRIALSAACSEERIDGLVDAIRRWREKN